MTNFLFWMDILGTFVFALTGAFRAIKYELDILGVLVLATCVGVGGGIARDLLLGLTPPVALRGGAFMLTTCVAGLCVFFFSRYIAPSWRYILYADGIGLALFAAVGAQKAYDSGLGVVGIMVIAAIASVGGGMIRDVLTREIPVVFTDDIYATAALSGGFVYWIVALVSDNRRMSFYFTLFFVIILRFIALKFRLGLPRSKKLPQSPSQIASKKK